MQNSRESNCARVNFFPEKFQALDLQLCLKKNLWHRCFPVDFAKILRTTFLRKSSERLLLQGRQSVLYVYLWRYYNYLFHSAKLSKRKGEFLYLATCLFDFLFSYIWGEKALVTKIFNSCVFIFILSVGGGGKMWRKDI